MADVEIIGLKELERKLKALPKEIAGKNLLGKALRKSANLIRDEAKKNAPYDATIPDNIHVKDSIKVRRDGNPKAKGKNEIMYIKPFSKVIRYTTKRGNKKRKKLSVGYWWRLEFGSVNTTKSRFMTKAFESKKMESLLLFKKELFKIIQRETKKLQK